MNPKETCTDKKLPRNFEYCTTIETNRVYTQIIPRPQARERPRWLAFMAGGSYEISKFSIVAKKVNMERLLK